MWLDRMLLLPDCPDDLSASRSSDLQRMAIQNSLDMPLTEFPSERTALRMSDCALAKNQVGDAHVHSKGYDLHSDGTERGHNKVVGHHVITKEQGTLSIGFVGVQTENTDTGHTEHWLCRSTDGEH